MKKLLLAIIIILLPVFVYASPFVICDTYTSGVIPDNFKVSMDGGAIVNSAPQAVTGGVRLHYDIGSVSVGNHNMSVSACKTYPADEWHPNPVEACSVSSPFAFTRPAEGTSPTGPVGIRLTSE